MQKKILAHFLVFTLFFSGSILCFSQPKDHTPELQEHYHTLIQAILRITDLYFYDARVTEAIDLLNAGCLKILEVEFSMEDRVRLQIQRAKMRLYKGSLLAQTADIEEAIVLLQKEEENAKNLKKSSIYAGLLDLIGWGIAGKELAEGLSSHQRYDPALPYFEKAYQLRKKIGDKKGMAESLSHIGLVYLAKKEPTESDKEKAFSYHMESNRVAKEVGDKLTQSYNTRHIGFIYLERGELDKALVQFQESLALRQEIGYKAFVPSSYLGVGLAYHQKGAFDTALKYYQIGLGMAEKNKTDRHFCQALLAIGNVLRDKKNVKKALVYYGRALEKARQMNYRHGIDQATQAIKSLEEDSIL